MSIETEFQSTIQNVQNAYNGLNNLGATIPQNKTIENIKSCLDEIYDNLPKTDYQEGTEVNLGVTSKGKLDYDNGVVGIGQSSQDSTQGYNLINFSSNQGSIVTVNGDGTITLNGTSSGFSINFTQVTFEANKTYSLFYKLISGTTSAGGVNVGLLSLFGDGSWVENNVRHSYTPEANTNRSTLWVAQNVTFTNAKFQIWVYEGNTDKPFERYSNNQASPSPNWKQPIKCVAGRNILDESLLETGNIDETTGQDVGNQYRKRSPYIEVDKNQPYTLSVQVSADIYLIAYFYNNQKTFISSSAKIGKQATYVLPSTTEYMRVVIANTSTTIATNIQLEEGTQATPYLPYNTIEETISGKNLLDESTLLQGAWNGTTTKRVYFYANNYLNAGTYTIMTDLNTTDFRYAVNIASNQFPLGSGMSIDVYDSSWTTTSYKTFTLSQGGYLGVGVKKANEGDIVPSDISSYHFMIYEGEYDSSISYEPYITPKTYQLSLGDIELNAIGNYKDELIYDVENDKVYKKAYIGEALLNGVQGSFSKPSTNRFNIDGIISDYAKLDNEISTMADFYKCYANKTTADDFNSLLANENYGLDLSSGTYPTIRVKDTRYDNTDQYKAWLSTNNVTIYYIKATPTLTELTDETLHAQVKALYNAHSNNGTTIITSNGNLPMIIKVRALKGE